MNAIERLSSCNIKPSVQRVAIMNYLIENRIHPNVDEIYSYLSPLIPTLSRTTVYNTLKLFAENGVISALTIDDKNICFDVDTSIHSHFLCKKCNRIYDVKCHISAETLNILKSEGHNVSETHYYYKGICKNCLA